MFEYSVSKDMEKKLQCKKRGFPTYLLVYLQKLIVKKLKICVEQGRVVTTIDIIKH